MDILNEEEAMFESPLLDSYLTSPATVSVCCVRATYTRQAKRVSLRKLWSFIIFKLYRLMS